MESWWVRPCGPFELSKGGYIIVLVDFIFITISVIVHTFELVYASISKVTEDVRKITIAYCFLTAYFCIHLLNTLLALTLLFGLRQKNIKKCQTYFIGSVLMLLIGWITFIVNACLLQESNLPYYFELICYPLFYLYKIYSLWIIKCFIVELIRRKRSANNSSFVSVRRNHNYDTGSNGSSGGIHRSEGISGGNSPNIGVLTNPMALGRGSGTSGQSYERVHGIDDILHQVEFPKDDQISSDKFRVDSEVLKIEDDFYVKKGVLEMSPGTFGPVSVKIFKQRVEVEAVRAMLLEAKILSMFKHQCNVIQLMGFCTENIHKGKMILLLEYCEQGNLEDFLKDNYPNFRDLIHADEIRNSGHSEEGESIYENIMLPMESKGEDFNSKTLVNWAHQIASGMEYITGKNIVHGNLTAKNVIVSKNRVKIGNFTFATQLYNYKNSNTPINFTKGQLPWRWMAIECMEVLNEKSFTEKSDVWSYGVTLWEIFSLGCVPYENNSTSEFFPKLLMGTRLEKPTFATSQIYQIIGDCWHHDPKQRPQFTQLKSSFREVLNNLA